MIPLPKSELTNIYNSKVVKDWRTEDFHILADGGFLREDTLNGCIYPFSWSQLCDFYP